MPDVHARVENQPIEPHPTRDGVDVVTYRCPIDGDIWRSVVVIRVEAGQYGKIATLLAP